MLTLVSKILRLREYFLCNSEKLTELEVRGTVVNISIRL